MSAYRAGQRVRIEWPNDTAVEGYVVHIGGTRPEVFCVLNIGGAISIDIPGNDDRTVTVLSEPRPNEPQGLGAVVEAVVDDGPGHHPRPWVLIPKSGSTQVGQEWHDGIGVCVWDQLIDPVVLREGWTP